MADWQWDETLYGGSAAHYAGGRLPYPESLAGALEAELALDGRGRLLDAGCGPGSLTLLLARLFEQAVGIDADPDMVLEAEREAERRGVANVSWRQLRAEQLPAGLGRFEVATFAQSFHWMNQPLVAHIVGEMLVAGGAWVHVNATTHQGVSGQHPPPQPKPPRAEINKLVQRYLGPVGRAGQSALPEGTKAGEEQVMRAAGYRGPRVVAVPRGEVFERTEDQVVASVYSLSSAAPHLFGDRVSEFEAELRRLLREASPAGRFSERARDIELIIWHRR